jgi:hypothetical protein
MNLRYSVLPLVLLCPAMAQTLVDLRTQSKSVDFTAASTTKPFKSGTALPATCSVGEAFFQTSAPAGTNLYACTSANSWTLETGPPGPQGPGGSTGPAGAQGPAGPAGAPGAIARIQNAGTNLPVEAVLNFTAGGCSDDTTNGRTNCNGAGISGLNVALNGTAVATQPTLNFISGTGIVQVCTNNTGANRVDCTPAVDTAYALSRTTDQAGTDKSVIATSTDGVTFTAGMNPHFSIYTQNQMLAFLPSVSCGNSPTLNLDSLGPIPLKKLSSGSLVALVSNDCIGGIPYVIIAHGNPVDAWVLRP